MTTTTKTGADELRAMVRWLNETRESILDQYTAEELLTLYRAAMKSGWDFYLDQWTPEQREDALAGILPAWDSSERPDRPADRSNAPKAAKAKRTALVFD